MNPRPAYGGRQPVADIQWQDSGVPEVQPETLAELRTLTEQAAEYRRQSYGRPRQLPRTEENRRAVVLLSRRLLLIAQMVKLHPELGDEYREWRHLYPTFTSDH